METTAHYTPETLVTKIVNFICCNGYCQDCCHSCFGTQEKVRRLSKSDIQHIVNHQPIPSLQSTTSHTSSLSNCSTLQSPGYMPSPSYNRERVDSDNSTSSHMSSRKGSTSSSEYRRSNPTPVIDMKPIEFWAANREAVQPRTPRRRMPSESEISIEDLKPDLYESMESSDECLTDEQKLTRFKLGQVHFSYQYDVPNKQLMIKVIEARDLPLPYSQDMNRQDMARSNPYAKVTLLPDQKHSQQTSVKRKTQEPVWEEAFVFEMSFKDAQRKTLEVIVKDFDKYSRHCAIGQVHMSLDDCNLIKGGHVWKPLLPSNKV